MTLNQWLSNNNYSVVKRPRGFSFENELGRGSYVEILPLDGHVTRFINDRDVYKWVAQEINHSSLFNNAARSGWREVEKP